MHRELANQRVELNRSAVVAFSLSPLFFLQSSITSDALLLLID